MVQSDSTGDNQRMDDETSERAARRGAGLTVRWGVARTRLGLLLVGATDRGVCCVLFADSAGKAAAALRAELPAATLVHDEGAVVEDLARVAALVDGQSSGDVPLDLFGTSFQRRVWAELRRIPPGQTATYADVARRIGEPTAARAVAGACASNHAAVVVPCHRVVRTDGGLGGYRWGVSRKRGLLDSERRRG